MSVTRSGGAPRPAATPQTQDAARTTGTQTQDATRTTGTAQTSATAPADATRDTYQPGTAQQATHSTGTAQVQQSVAARHSEGMWGRLRGAADRLGGTVTRAGEALETGGQALQRAGVPGADAVVGAGRTAQSTGQGIQAAPDAAVRAAGEVHRQVQQVGDDAQRVVENVREGVAEATQEVGQALQTVQRGAQSVQQAGEQFGRSVGEAVDYRRNIEQLGPGDRYTVQLGGNASVEGGKVYGRGAIEVQRQTDGRYTVSASGEAGGGVYGELGGRAGMRASGTAEATLGAGGRVEMTFNTAAEAQRATEILMRNAASGAAQAAGNASQIPGSGIVGNVASHALAPSAEDNRWLAGHTSAVELRGTAAAEISGGLGLADEQTRLLGAFGRGAVRGESAVRMEFNNGHPSALVLRDQVTAEVGAGAGVGLQTGAGNDGGTLGVGLGGTGQAQLTMERRYTLPSGLDADAVMRNPAQALSSAAQQIRGSEQRTLGMQLDVQGQAAGNGGGLRAQLQFQGNTDQVLTPAVMQRAMGGDLGGALRQAGDQVTVSGNITPYAQTGVSLSPALSVMGFGVGVEAQAIRQDVADQPLWQQSGTATQTADAMDRFIREHPDVLLN